MTRTQIETIAFDTLKEYENKLIAPETCKKCGGKCCQHSGCECHPRDFDYDPDKMYRALKTGNYSITVSDIGGRAFKKSSKGITLNLENILNHISFTLYIRMRNQNRPVVDLLHFDDIEGPCTMWSPEYGCKLSFSERPLYGRLLHPRDSDNSCFTPLGRVYLKSSWKEFQDILIEYAKEFLTPEDLEWYKTTFRVSFYL